VSTARTDLPEFFIRHAWYRRVEHHVVSLVFIVLCITGLAQRFHTHGWSEWIIATVGGIDNNRLIHRSAGGLFSVLFVGHLLVAFAGVVWLRWAPTMLVSVKDFQDAVQNLRYYMRLTDTPPRFDRYDYRSKFEYWGIVLGGVMMTLTGFILWFPVLLFKTFTFIPGDVIPIAKAVHSNEAMLATLVVVVWHIYNAVFSPEVFPLDTSIFNGKISLERMHHEHPVELERILSEQHAPPPSSEDP
jgi:formate dehydrogenase subunit gamma